MASGFPGGGDFYSSAGIGGGGSSMINNVQVQYRSQLGGILVDSSSPIVPPRRNDLLAKRSLADLEQQQGFLLRSVKQRSYQHQTSPISPLSPVEFSPMERYGYGYGQGHVRGHGLPLVQQLRPQSIIPNPNTQNNSLCNPSLSNLSFSQIVQNRAVFPESEPDLKNKMKNQLEELEKQLLDDNEGEDGDAASVITSEWTETMQNLINPNQKTLSPSPTSSSSSSSSSLSSVSPKQSLIDAATAISEGNIDAAMSTLEHLKLISNTRGDPEQRLTAYMVSALRSRMNPMENPPPQVMELSSSDHRDATQMLYEASPCFELGFMAANLAILEATRDQPNNVHIVDFDIGHGSQYMTLLHALADRLTGRTGIVRITTVTDPTNRNEDGLRGVGDRLRKIAKQVGVELRFNVVSKKLSDLNRVTLECEPNEALVVNFAFRLYKMPDESVSTENPRDELLRVVKGLTPRIVTMVEQEMNCNTAPFVARLNEACDYYRALFDSLDSTMTRDSNERVKIEKCLARKLVNSVACEGRDRVERCEVFGKWRARMGMAGFESRPLGQHVGEFIRVRLGSTDPTIPSFTMKEEAGGICLGWTDRVLTVASAWR